MACEHFKAALPWVKNVLVLGSGLGSIAEVIKNKGFLPKYTFVEKDKTVLHWAIEFANEHIAKGIEPVCADAADFMEHNTRQFSFIFVDIFDSRVVPEFVCTARFLQQCRAAMAPDGHLAFNYIVNDREEWVDVQRVFQQVFPGYKTISRGENKILVV